MAGGLAALDVDPSLAETLANSQGSSDEGGLRPPPPETTVPADHVDHQRKQRGSIDTCSGAEAKRLGPGQLGRNLAATPRMTVQAFTSTRRPSRLFGRRRPGPGHFCSAPNARLPTIILRIGPPQEELSLPGARAVLKSNRSLLPVRPPRFFSRSHARSGAGDGARAGPLSTHPTGARALPPQSLAEAPGRRRSSSRATRNRRGVNVDAHARHRAAHHDRPTLRPAAGPTWAGPPRSLPTGTDDIDDTVTNGRKRNQKRGGPGIFAQVPRGNLTA